MLTDVLIGENRNALMDSRKLKLLMPKATRPYPVHGLTALIATEMSVLFLARINVLTAT
jgi:hypothetical protein